MSDLSLKAFAASLNRPLTWLAVGMFVVSGWVAILVMPNPMPAWANVTNWHLTAWGLIVTVGGFAITLFQLSETKTSFEAAKTAVEKWKRQKSNVQIIDDIRESMTLLRNCLELVGNDWSNFKKTYDQVRLLNASVLASRRELHQEEASFLDEMQIHITEVCSQLDDQLAAQNVNVVVAELSTKIRELQNFFVGLDQAIKDRIDE